MQKLVPYKNYLALLFLFLNGLYSYEQGQLFARAVSVADSIPLDPEVILGKLPNGFTYYIRKNAEPKNKVMMYLVVKAGYNQEEEDQIELAHLLEHLPFRGTSNFANPYEYFGKNGLKQGTDINASTGDEMTTYYLSLPSSRSEVVRDGLQFLRDCAQGNSFELSEIDKERETILDEERGGIEYVTSMKRQFIGVLMGDSKYAIRAKSDIKDNIKKFEHKSLFRFYHDWYRPDLQGVVVVGSIDVDRMREQIKLMFSDLKKPVNARPSEELDSSFNWNDEFVIVTHKKMPRVEVQVYVRKPYHTPVSTDDFRISTIGELASVMINRRFSEIQYSSNFPERRLEVYYREKFPVYGPDFSALNICVNSETVNLKSDIQSVIIELKRLEKHGFTEKELFEGKASIDKTHLLQERIEDSNEIARKLIQHFFDGTATPSSEYFVRLKRKFISEISLEDVNMYIQDFISVGSKDVVILAPDGEKSNLPDKILMSECLDEINLMEIKPYQDKVVMPLNPLMTEEELSHLPTNLKFSQKTIKEIGVTRISLPNGIEVFLKPICDRDSADKKVLFKGFRSGGTSLYSDIDFFSAHMAASIVAQSGLGSFNDVELKKYMKDKQVSASPYIIDNEEGIIGFSQSSRNVEFVFQLIYQYLTNPKKDIEIFKKLLDFKKKDIEESSPSPNEVFSNAINAAIANGNFRKQPPTLEHLKQVSLDRVYQIYHERLSNPSGLKFTIAGNFDAKMITALVVKYLGAIPPVNGSIVNKFLRSETRQGFHDDFCKIFYADMRADRADVQIRFRGPFKFSPKNNLRVDLLKISLQLLLFDQLRTKEAGVYSVVVNAAYTGNSKETNYEFIIGFTCSPSKVDDLICSALGVIKGKGPDATSFQMAIASIRKRALEDFNSSEFWTNYLSEQLQRGENLKEVKKLVRRIDRLTYRDLRKAASIHFEENVLLKFILLPKGMQYDINEY